MMSAVGRRSPSAVRRPLPAARCPLPAARCPLPAARCPPSAARCPLATAFTLTELQVVIMIITILAYAGDSMWYPYKNTASGFLK